MNSRALAAMTPEDVAALAGRIDRRFRRHRCDDGSYLLFDRQARGYHALATQCSDMNAVITHALGIFAHERQRRGE